MYDLERFKRAQQSSYESALNEIKNGRKTSHWMWYIFPQIIGLGESSTSIYYAIKSYEEAIKYLEDEELKNNLYEITQELLNLEETNPAKIFGSIDALKLKSSMTLFYEVSQDELFNEVLNKYYDGEKDETTIRILSNMSPAVLSKKVEG